MRNRVSPTATKSLIRLSAVVLLASALSGCSSDVSRFGGLFSKSDDITTNSIPARGANGNVPVPSRDVESAGIPLARSSVARDEAISQPFPETAQDLPPYDPVNTATTPVSGARLASTPMSVRRTPIVEPETAERERPIAQPFPAERQAERQEMAHEADPVTTGRGKPGWTTANAPSVMMRQGDTVAVLSRKFGVPEKEILKANDLASASQAEPGQRLVIPVYGVTSSAAKAAASDQTASLDTERRTPVPTPAEGREYAILPGQSQSRDKGARTADTASGKLGNTGDGKRPSAKPETLAKPETVAKVKPEPEAKQKPETVAKAKTETVPVAKPEKVASLKTDKPVAKKTEPVQTASASGGYTVQPGDSLNKIAKKTGVPVDALKQANGLTSASIRVGQTLALPKGGKVITDPVKTASLPQQKTETKVAKAEAVKADGKTPAEYTPPVAKKTVNEAVDEGVADASPKSTGISKYRWPVRGAVTAGYGANVDGNRNDGINISVPEGTPIKAAENGVVIYSGSSLKELGNAVLVRHDDGTVTVYGNASALNVQRGQKVQRGQTLAASGMSGKASQPQVHFEVRKNASAVNPSTFLE